MLSGRKHRNIRKDIHNLLASGPKAYSELLTFFKGVGVAERTFEYNLKQLKDEGWITKLDDGRWATAEWKALSLAPEFRTLQERENYLQHCKIVAQKGFPSLILEANFVLLRSNANKSQANGGRILEVVSEHEVDSSAMADVRWRPSCQQIDEVNSIALGEGSNLYDVKLRWHPLLLSYKPWLAKPISDRSALFKDIQVMKPAAEQHLFSGYPRIYGKLSLMREAIKRLRETVEKIPLSFEINYDMSCFKATEHLVLAPEGQSQKYEKKLLKVTDKLIAAEKDFISEIVALKSKVIVANNTLLGYCELCPREKIGRPPP